MASGPLRWVLNTAATLILADAIVSDEKLVPGAGWWLWFGAVVALIGLALTSPSVQPYVYRPVLKRIDNRLHFTFEEPIHPARKRLARYTRTLVRDIRSYMAESEPDRPLFPFDEVHGAMTENQADQAIAKYRHAVALREHQFNERFGARLDYIVGEYKRRGMVSDEGAESWSLVQMANFPDMPNGVEVLVRLESLSIALLRGRSDE